MRLCAYAHVLVVLASVFLHSCTQWGSKDILLDVKAIVNKSPKEVEKIIGTPDSTYTLQIMGKKTFCQLYKKHNIEIQYPKLLATDIIVYGPHELPFNQTALSAFNLDYRVQHPSDYMKDRFIRWSDFEEFSAITFYNTKKDSLNNITDFNIFFKVKD